MSATATYNIHYPFQDRKPLNLFHRIINMCFAGACAHAHPRYMGVISSKFCQIIVALVGVLVSNEQNHIDIFITLDNHATSMH